MTTATALAGLLAVVAADRDARCRAILAPAEEAAAALVAAARAEARQALRHGIAADRREMQAEVDRAAARRDGTRRGRDLRLAQAAVDAGWSLLLPALLERWQDPMARRCWVRAALAVARRRLPPGGWRIRHPPGFDPAEAQEAAGEGMAWEAAEAIAAGIEIRAGNACLDATSAGLLADRERVAGRLLHFWGLG